MPNAKVYGAFIGDVEGSVYEFASHRAPYSFDLFNPRAKPTDDSIMTLAVLEICEKHLWNSKQAVCDTFRKWGHKYPSAGYGGRFYGWLLCSDTLLGYNSYGNGSAMRISPVGYYAKDEEEVKRMSKAITEVSHNHPEGLKGAEVTALCVYYGYHHKSKDFLKKYAESQYKLYGSVEELNASNHGHGDEICQVSVPQALSAFFLTDSFESCLRTIVSAGGDCDTTAAIACAIAGAYYQADEKSLISFIKGFFRNDDEALDLFKKFEEAIE
jgi:ADP-ribosyl-[dinitrogen reductase] hydrolase